MPATETSQNLPAQAKSTALEVGPDVVILSVSPSGCTDTRGAVDADLVVRVGEHEVECEVTLCPNEGRPTRRGRHPLDTWGPSIDFWAGDSLIRAIERAEESDEDWDRGDLIAEIVATVDADAEQSDLT